MELDFSRCIICQEKTAEELRCPLLNPSVGGDKKSAAYQSFLTNVEKFREIDLLPTELKFGSDETVDTFVNNSASWHESCHVQFSNYKLARARKRKESNPHENESEQGRQPRKRRSIIMIEQCFLCEKGADTDNPLHHVSSYDMDTGIKTMISELQDTELFARIVGSDLMAMDATYHLTCLTHLRNRYRSHMRQLQKATINTDDIMNEARTFVELAGYIEMSVNAGTLIFKLSEFHTLYVNRLEELNIIKTINKTRLKEQLLERFPDAQAQHDGRNIVIIFKDGMKDMIKDAMKKRDFTEDAQILAQAATIVRKDIFHHEGFQFTGQFPPGCQEKSLPSSLQCLVSMILNGPNLIESDDSQVCLTVGQTIFHNVKKRKPNFVYESPAHSKQRTSTTNLHWHKYTRTD
ncbi:hypothetical protein BSL78_27124 [Apostichopus japonicus]|uniref:Uncharacterized protein n=1 Tax=Stichopus japonicus TaxID=307972 RepID=A0A2G8JK11_STIJA|nr:hypothetical protein BSL78_27124 [Apostichopus japonicus]